MAGNKAEKIHLVLTNATFGDYATSCGHIYPPLRVTKDPKEVTCQQCRRVLESHRVLCTPAMSRGAR
jgi:hypothetical protein